MNRTEKSIKNFYFAIIGQIAGIIISFLSRYFFIKCLSTEYLGINGLFTNVLQMLSLVELDIGAAIIYTLYKPLAENDSKKVAAIMQIYKKAYIIIGCIVLFLGIITTPFITFLIDDTINISLNIYIIFILFVFNTGISYFFSYKRNLIIADQKRYIATIYRYVIYFLVNLSQIIILYLTRNYYLYLITQIVFTFIENLLVSIKANKLYPYLNSKKIEKIDKDTKNKIKKNIKAMGFHKVGGLAVNSTDNILLSKIINVASVGLYSNYYLIISALNTVISQFFSSISASIGNVNAIESKEKSIAVFKRIEFINFWIISFSSVCFLCLVNDFIKIWLGEDLLLDYGIVIVLTISFYLNGMRKTVLTFRDTFGLYWEDRYKPLVEVLVNLITSIILGYKLGIIGIFLGTVISTVTTCIWIEPLILYKFGFKDNSNYYFLSYFKYMIITLLMAFITFLIVSVVHIGGIAGLIIKIILCIIIVNISIIVIFRKTNEFKYCINLIKKMVKKILFKRKCNYYSE